MHAMLPIDCNPKVSTSRFSVSMKNAVMATYAPAHQVLMCGGVTQAAQGQAAHQVDEFCRLYYSMLGLPCTHAHQARALAPLI